jgi:hypothetical protein
MSEQNDYRDHRDDLEIPRALVDDLAALYDRPIDVPPEIDARVKEAAWRHFGRRRRHRMPLIRWVAPLAAAAVVVIMLLSVNRASKGPAMAPSFTEMKEKSRDTWGDFDGDGRFDIIDVLALAQDLERDHVIDTRWDANGDGIVDGDDVDVLGQDAVTLY